MGRRAAPSRGALRAFVETFPPLKLALAINDAICYVFQSILEAIWFIISFIYRQIYNILGQCFSRLNSLIYRLPLPRAFQDVQYKRIRKSKLTHYEPVPHRNKLVKRMLTYQLGVILGLALYIFVYFVLIKHHSYMTIAVALVLMLAYFVVLENSNNIRSIIMLSLPIMFTNRGRALVFCAMLAIMVAGPVKNTRFNIHEMQNSLNCSRDYLVLHMDRTIQKDVIDKLVRLEDVIMKIHKSLEEFADDIRKKFDQVKNLLITVEHYLEVAYTEIIKVVQICNAHTQEIHSNCINTFKYAYEDCRNKLGSTFNFLCEIVAPLDKLCAFVELPDKLCEIPRSIKSIGERIYKRQIEPFFIFIQNAFAVQIDPNYDYNYTMRTSKNFTEAVSEIKYDLEQKFWYIHFISRIFNVVTLILVIWILLTATLYHMHFLDELPYDNMYIDDNIRAIDERRKRKLVATKRDPSIDLNQGKGKDDTLILLDDDEVKTESPQKPNNGSEDGRDRKQRVDYLFPMTKSHQGQYLKPFSLAMNDSEKHKLYIAGFIWLAIVGYIFFFVLMDFTLYHLIKLIYDVLEGILFDSDLPIIEVTSKTDLDHVTRYNRTYLRKLSSDKRKELAQVLNVSRNEDGVINNLYRRLMDSIERGIPDDVDILDSLEGCLPQARAPNYHEYRQLAFLAGFTFVAVIVEAYALRTRHCIGNLFYPIRAKRRAAWLYKKMMSEKVKFVDVEFRSETKSKEPPADQKFDWLDTGLKILAGRVKR